MSAWHRAAGSEPQDLRFNTLPMLADSSYPAPVPDVRGVRVDPYMSNFIGANQPSYYQTDTRYSHQASSFLMHCSLISQMRSKPRVIPFSFIQFFR